MELKKLMRRIKLFFKPIKASDLFLGDLRDFAKTKTLKEYGFRHTNDMLLVIDKHPKKGMFRAKATFFFLHVSKGLSGDKVSIKLYGEPLFEMEKSKIEQEYIDGRLVRIDKKQYEETFARNLR